MPGVLHIHGGGMVLLEAAGAGYGRWRDELAATGMVYREQENYTAAVETFRKMLPLGEENARSGYQEMIDTYREAKQWPQATAVAKEAVQKLPNDRDLRMVPPAAAMPSDRTRARHRQTEHRIERTRPIF